MLMASSRFIWLSTERLKLVFLSNILKNILNPPSAWKYIILITFSSCCVTKLFCFKQDMNPMQQSFFSSKYKMVYSQAYRKKYETIIFMLFMSKF